MPADHMFWRPSGKLMTYVPSSGTTPVPLKTYRCPATATEASEHNHAVDRKHVCKLVVDHSAEEHECVCNKKWEPVLV